MEKTMAEWGFNKKGRPSGSGTTSNKRKEARKAKQWSFLEKDDPTSKRCLEKHKQALEKALEKASSKLESLEKDELDAAMDDVAELTASSTSSAPVLEKAKSSVLEKAQSTVPGKAQSTVLGKAQSTVLGKAPRKGKLGPRQVFLRDTSPETELAGGLEKLNLHSKNKPLEKGSKDVKKEDEKLVVLLDWHNTLEKDDEVPESHLEALEKLLGKADEVHLLSYVGSWKRQGQVMHDMYTKLPQWMLDEMASIATCWEKTGVGGKCAIACDWGCHAVFDDAHDILRECKAWGLEVYGVQKPGLWGMDGLSKGERFDSFPEAVDAYLEKHK